MGLVENLLGALVFSFPPGPAWRALVPVLAAAWVVGFGALAPALTSGLASWRERDLQRAALRIWAALLPSVLVAAEYVARVLARAPTQALVTAIVVFVPNVAAPFWVVKSFRLLGPTARPMSFQVARALCVLAWLCTWLLWLTTMFISCMTA